MPLSLSVKPAVCCLCSVHLCLCVPAYVYRIHLCERVGGLYPGLRLYGADNTGTGRSANVHKLGQIY